MDVVEAGGSSADAGGVVCMGTGVEAADGDRECAAVVDDLEGVCWADGGGMARCWWRCTVVVGARAGTAGSSSSANEVGIGDGVCACTARNGKACSTNVTCRDV